MKPATGELVRISDKGVAHPIGTIASRRLREREGAFRMLPSPTHVVFMRYTGEDGRRDDEDGAVVRLAGEITAPAALADIFAMLAHTRWRGELVVTVDQRRRSIFIDNGLFVGVQTNVPEERLGQILFRFGAIDEQDLSRIEAEIEKGNRFGQAAIDLEILSQEQVYEHLGRQIDEVVFACLGVADGTFFFLEGFDVDRLVSQHTRNMNAVLMDTVTRLDEMRYFRAKIPSEDWIPVPSDRTDAPDESCHAIFEAIDGKRSLAELGRLTGLGEFETTKMVYTLAQSKHVTLRPPRITGGPTAIVEAANSALRTIHAKVDEQHRGFSFRAALKNFAAGAGVYAMLMRGAGPEEDGSFDAERVAENMRALAGDDPEEFLKGKLHAYVGFALFSAGNVLGESAEHALTAELESLLAALQPLA